MWSLSLSLSLTTYSVFVDVDDLIGHRGIVFNLLVAIAHGLVVGVLDAALNVAKEESFAPLPEPLTRGVPWLYHCHLLLNLLFNLLALCNNLLR